MTVPERSKGETRLLMTMMTIISLVHLSSVLLLLSV